MPGQEGLLPPIIRPQSEPRVLSEKQRTRRGNRVYQFITAAVDSLISRPEVGIDQVNSFVNAGRGLTERDNPSSLSVTLYTATQQPVQYDLEYYRPHGGATLEITRSDATRPSGVIRQEYVSLGSATLVTNFIEDVNGEPERFTGGLISVHSPHVIATGDSVYLNGIRSVFPEIFPQSLVAAKSRIKI